MKIIQVELQSYPEPNRHLICWLSNTNGIKVREKMIISLGDKLAGMWKVLNVYSTQELHTIHRKWPVGGL